jgi:hypothetical protein
MVAAMGPGGSVYSVEVTNGGTDYTSAPDVVFTGTSTGAAATATVINGIVTAVNVTNGGSGCNVAPTVSFTGGGGLGAAASATLTGVVNGITMTPLGSGYTTAPTLTRFTTYYYQVVANNVVGYTQTYAAPAVGYPSLSADSSPVQAPLPITTLDLNAPEPIFADSFETGLNM